jgi:hypothetical protein
MPAGISVGNMFGQPKPQLSAEGKPLVGSMEWAQSNVNAYESTPDFWSGLEKDAPATFAQVMDTAQRGAGIPTGGISVTGPNISGSSPQRLIGADFAANALFGEDNAPSDMIKPATDAFKAAYGHNPWDINPSTGTDYGPSGVGGQPDAAILPDTRGSITRDMFPGDYEGYLEALSKASGLPGTQNP